MQNFSVKFLREFEVDIQADSIEAAHLHARRVIAQFSADTCKLVSITTAGPCATSTGKAKRRSAMRQRRTSSFG